MQGIQIADPKAPWVMFERRAVEDRNASLEQGRYVTKDVDFALITPHGSKDQIERICSEWFVQMEQQVREGRFESAWLRSYKNAYEEWKLGNEMPVEGTPILNWPVLSPSQVNMLKANKILTVEVLAQANEETIARLGMGGRRLVQTARDYLAQATGPGKVASQMTELRAKSEGLEKIVAEQSVVINELQRRLKQAEPEAGGPSDPLHEHQAYRSGRDDTISAGDLLGDDKPAVRKL